MSPKEAALTLQNCGSESPISLVKYRSSAPQGRPRSAHTQIRRPYYSWQAYVIDAVTVDIDGRCILAKASENQSYIFTTRNKALVSPLSEKIEDHLGAGGG